jgi:hypothetical protein
MAEVESSDVTVAYDGRRHTVPCHSPHLTKQLLNTQDCSITYVQIQPRNYGVISEDNTPVHFWQ